MQFAVWFMISIISLNNLDSVTEAMNSLIESLSIESKFIKHIAYGKSSRIQNVFTIIYTHVSFIFLFYF